MVVWLNDGQGRVPSRSVSSGSRAGGYYRRSFLNQNEAETVMSLKAKPLISAPYSDQDVLNIGYCCNCMPQSSALCNRNYYQLYGWKNILNYPPEFSRVFFHDFYYCCTVPHSQIYPRLKCQDIGALKLSDETISRTGIKTIKRCLQSVETGFCMTFCRTVAYIFFKLFKCISRGILVDEGRIRAIKDACRYLAKQNNEDVERCPCVYLPLHASHLDYHILALVAFCNDMPLPFIGAGNNLDIPIFRLAIKNAGGFFIRRGGSSLYKNPVNINSVASFANLTSSDDSNAAPTSPDDSDALSRAILRWTLQTLISNDQDIEFYIEGTRTRNGRPMSPRVGLLSLLIDCLEKQDIPDVCIVPTCLTYERVWELDDVINEQLGHEKQKETLWSSFKATLNVLRTFCGLIRVDYAEPFSLREFIERVRNMEFKGNSAVVARNAPSPSSTSPSAFTAASLLAQHVIYDCGRIAPITLTHALSFLILTKFRQGDMVENIAKHMLLLRREIICRGYEVTFSDDDNKEMCEAVIYAAGVLGCSAVACEINSENGAPSIIFLRPCRHLQSVLTLAYFAARVLLVFAAEAAVASSFVAATKLTKTRLGSLSTLLNHADSGVSEAATGPDTADTEFRIGQSVLIERAEILCRLLAREVIFVPPCRDLNSELQAALNRLLSSDILRYRDAPTRPYVNHDIVDPADDADESDYSDEGEFGGVDADEEDENDEPCFAAPLSGDVSNNVPNGPVIELDMMNAVPAAKRLIELHSYVLPILEAQWVTACNIASFVDDPTLLQRDRDFVSLCQRDAIDTFEDGNICFAESASTVTLSNAVKCFEHYGFLKRSGAYLELGPFAARHNEAKVVEGLICLLEYFRLLPDADYPSRSSIYSILINHLNA